MICGIDESGRGAVIGPLVICAVCTDEEYVKKIGSIVTSDREVRDDSVRKLIYLRTRKFLKVIEYVVVDAPVIDYFVSQGLLNEMLASYMTLAIANVVTQGYMPWIVKIDSPIKKWSIFKKAILDYFNALEIPIPKQNIFVKAGLDEEDPIVALAGVLAKLKRDTIVQQLKKKYGDFGSGYPSDVRTRSWLRKLIEQGKELPPIVRKTWTTVENIVKEIDKLKQLNK